MAMTWSIKSRRQLSAHRSAIPFCQGLRNEFRIGRIAIELTAIGTSNPFLASRSKMRDRRADCKGNASRNCCTIHVLVGCRVTLKCRTRRRWWPMTKKQQSTKFKGWDGEEVHRRDYFPMVAIAQEVNLSRSSFSLALFPFRPQNAP